MAINVPVIQFPYERILAEAEEVEINEWGEIVPIGFEGRGVRPPPHKFYGGPEPVLKSKWFCFLSSLDRETPYRILCNSLHCKESISSLHKFEI